MKVNRDTRAGNWGRMIRCPFCQEIKTVYHFAWGAVQCQKCKKMVDKPEWDIV
jgi:ribosomal protein S27E